MINIKHSDLNIAQQHFNFTGIESKSKKTRINFNTNQSF